MILYTHQFSSPRGEMIVAVDEDGAVAKVILPNGHEHWETEVARRGYTIIEDPARCAAAITQLEEYFQGKRKVFDLPVKPEGTPFQQSVWSVLRTIPYGTTITYKELAERIGNLAAIRAVGRANGTNPIPIIIPCHRVIGSDGSLIGFGGGLALKEYLLRLEGADVPALSSDGDSKQLALF